VRVLDLPLTYLSPTRGEKNYLMIYANNYYAFAGVFWNSIIPASNRPEPRTISTIPDVLMKLTTPTFVLANPKEFLWLKR
jgi:hypothetical protein